MDPEASILYTKGDSCLVIHIECLAYNIDGSRSKYHDCS